LSRQQAGAIAVRRDGETLTVCLIRRKGSESWGIPKGFLEPGDTPEKTALKEAWEEAGLKGRLIGDSIGSYEYSKRSGSFTVAVYVMDVLEQAPDWPEAILRECRWAPWDEAASLLASHPVRPLLDQARRRAAGGEA
jgi:8-oxo-dGTP pyrophosphatase MutT (NUDIX family)